MSSYSQISCDYKTIITYSSYGPKTPTSRWKWNFCWIDSHISSVYSWCLWLSMTSKKGILHFSSYFHAILSPCWFNDIILHQAQVGKGVWKKVTQAVSGAAPDTTFRSFRLVPNVHSDARRNWNYFILLSFRLRSQLQKWELTCNLSKLFQNLPDILIS